ncbi:MAG: iron-sulfur cluster insertion protein ErpA [Bdellovibrionaceae bacterium]|nr:iron-sulfur cluster insertion protein ErpA [Pseudobdellovibrionaceae bacterium]
MIKITDKAAKRIKELIKDEGLDSHVALRVKVKRGGCSGFSYNLDFDKETPSDKDKIFEDKEVKLIIDSESLLYLVGLNLDFEGGLNGAGFVFSNPNATKTCGCGSSFAV